MIKCPDPVYKYIHGFIVEIKFDENDQKERERGMLSMWYFVIIINCAHFHMSSCHQCRYEPYLMCSNKHMPTIRLMVEHTHTMHIYIHWHSLIEQTKCYRIHTSIRFIHVYMRPFDYFACARPHRKGMTKIYDRLHIHAAPMAAGMCMSLIKQYNLCIQ